jgi:DNA-binding NarL/FixJ family response regulator
VYRVVIIDDHPVVRMAVRSLLEANGQFVVVGEREDGVTGLAAVRELMPDMLIVDLGVPLLGGIEVIERLRRDKMGVGVLVVSAQEEGVGGVRALRAGANGYVHKSGGLDDLVMAAMMVARGKSFFGQSILVAAAEAPNVESEDALSRLSAREFEVFRFLAQGQSNSVIAKHLLISNKTVSGYKSKLMAKLGLKNIVQLVEVAKLHKVV